MAESGSLVPHTLRLRPERAPAPPNDVDVQVGGDAGPQVSEVSGTTVIDTGDGVIVHIDRTPGQLERDDADFDDNLAEYLSEADLNLVAEEVLDGIAADERSRAEWLETRRDGIRMLGLKVE